MVSLSRELPRHAEKLSKAEIARLIGQVVAPVILEIGCNDGSDTLEFAQQFPDGMLHCFEPDVRPIERFKAKEFGARVRLHPVAVGDRDGVTTLHMSGGTTRGAHLKDWDLSSSIHEPTGHLKMSPWCTFDRTCEVPIIRLDTWLRNHQPAVIDFIWADVQGAEGDLIRGGTETLARTRYFYTEYYDREQYRGQPNLRQIIEMLGTDWEPLGIYEGYNVLLKNSRIA